MHAYSIHRDPRNFSKPDTFWPERWLFAASRAPDMGTECAPPAGFTHAEGAFSPFSYGPMNCVGKNLALTEMRMVICHFMQKLELNFPEGYDPMDWDRQLEDRFVMKIGTLPVMARPRPGEIVVDKLKIGGEKHTIKTQNLATGL